MTPTTIRVVRVMSTSDMSPGGLMRLSGTRRMRQTIVRADVHVHVPGLNGRANIRMAFPAPPGTDRGDWAKIAYERALMMLDSA